ncbi:MAG: bifunctional diaminohydroxyphosphoribosylaminopyrimidine deaminase/5-amino-6-(5-phosphoribosylamino)uracil reductase RibD [Pseudomonadota bacterium]
MSEHHLFMAHALKLAQKGCMTTHPNPMVGCVFVKDGEIIGEGFHLEAGQAHAEVNALKDAREKGMDVSGATAYVTLEPCSHQGKTGPCCNALVAAGVSEVVVAMTDPNPEVSGRGIAYLRAHGVSVIEGVLQQQAEELNRAFMTSMREGRPFVQVKIATSMDGRTAMASGESQWITDAAAREDVQRLRAQVGAIVTGSGTLYGDNPSLTVRPANWLYPELSDDERIRVARQQPLRVVVSSKAPDPQAEKYQIFTDGVHSIWASSRVSDHFDFPEHIDSWVIKPVSDDESTERVCLLSLLQRLHSERQVRSVLVEAGAQLAGVFVAHGLVDEIIMYMAPSLMGSDAVEMLTLPIAKMQDKVALRIKSVRQVGETVRICSELA